MTRYVHVRNADTADTAIPPPGRRAVPPVHDLSGHTRPLRKGRVIS